MAMNTTPFIMRKPKIELGSGPITLECMGRTVKLTPADTLEDVGTFCAEGAEAPGLTKWVAEIELLMSYDSADGVGDGLWNQLHPLAKTQVTFAFTPSQDAVSTANPKFTGKLWVPSIAPLDGTPGKPHIFTLTCSVAGEPTIAFS